MKHCRDLRATTRNSTSAKLTNSSDPRFSHMRIGRNDESDQFNLYYRL
jgi:hypothetical protein